MWSYLHDEHGRERCAIFYKAAFYDRDAFLTISPRYVDDVERESQDQDKRYTCRTRGVVRDGKNGGVAYAGPWRKPKGKDRSAFFAVEDLAREDAKAWLKEHVPADTTEQWAHDAAPSVVESQAKEP